MKSSHQRHLRQRIKNSSDLTSRIWLLKLIRSKTSFFKQRKLRRRSHPSSRCPFQTLYSQSKTLVQTETDFVQTKSKRTLSRASRNWLTRELLNVNQQLWSVSIGYLPHRQMRLISSLTKTGKVPCSAYWCLSKSCIASSDRSKTSLSSTTLLDHQSVALDSPRTKMQSTRL